MWLGHPPRTASYDGERPPGGIGDPGPGPGGTLMSIHGNRGRHLSEGNCQNSHSMTACQAPEDDFKELKSNLHLLRHQMLTGRPWEKEACQPVSPPVCPSTSVVGPSTPAQTKRRPALLRTLSLGEGTLVKHREDHTDHLPHCSTTNLAFFWEQMELEWQAQTLPARCMKRPKWMVIQKWTSFCNSVTDVLDGWGTRNDSLSCGLPQWGPI